MFLKRFLILVAIFSLVFSASLGFSQSFPESQDDPVLKRIIELGMTDNQAMKWLDIACNRFGGRYTGTDAYNNAAEWAVYEFRKWGMQVELDEVGEVPVGFNRGPYFGKMIEPTEKALYFGTPSYTAGTKGVQQGPAVIAPEDSMQILSMKDQFKDAWVLIPGDSRGFARDGRRETRKSFLVRTLEETGALGTIQRARVPIQMMDGAVSSWEDLPTLPDIKLQDIQYDEIKGIVSGGNTVELEFEIRNWFKLGPVKYHNIIAWIPGTTYPDEYVIMSGHFDSFDGATGAVDDGSGFTPGMEAARLILKAGGTPKRTIMVHLFAAEENGIIGSQSWIRKNPEKIPKIAVLMNRDGSPSAITGVTVPGSWSAGFEKIVEPLKNLNPTFPFELSVNNYPGTRATRAGGTDASAFSMVGVPTLRMNTETDYQYSRAWHTLFDTYNEVEPYREHQEHSALVMAVLAYGIANLDRQLSRDDVYLADGLYADINTAKGRIMASLDFENVPATVASFVKLFEASGAQSGGRQRGRQQRVPTIGIFEKIDLITAAHAAVTAEAYKSRADVKLPEEKNPGLIHDRAGVLGMISPTQFYITSDKKTAYDGKYTPIGTVIAGLDIVSTIAQGDSIRSVRITRIGQKARDFRRQ